MKEKLKRLLIRFLDFTFTPGNRAIWRDIHRSQDQAHADWTPEWWEISLARQMGLDVKEVKRRRAEFYRKHKKG